MNEDKHTVLFVDDEENILNSLKRLLRKEGYRLLTASSGPEALELLGKNDVHVVISDQRMPDMSGTEFFARAREEFPEAIRIILSGYTDVDSITESINKGHIYKFLLKPWNDETLKLEIRQALEQYELRQANKRLHEKVLEQNEELKEMNENLEGMVRERTRDLEIQNQALELSRAILEDLPLPIIGVSAEGMIVIMNREAESMADKINGMKLGRHVNDCFSPDVEKKMSDALKSGMFQEIKGSQLSGTIYDFHLTPLSGRFHGKGVVLVLRPSGE